MRDTPEIAFYYSSLKNRVLKLVLHAAVPEVLEEFWSGKETRLSHRCSFTTEILHANTSLAGTDPTGQIYAGRLQVQGPLKLIDFERDGIMDNSEI